MGSFPDPVNYLSKDEPVASEDVGHDQGENDEDGYEDADGIDHIAEEAGHFDAGLFGDGFDHEVWSVADVGVGAHKDGAQRDGDEHLYGDGTGGGLEAVHNGLSFNRRDGAGGFKEDNVGGGVIEETAECTGGPEEVPGLGESHVGTFLLENFDGDLHGDEDADKEGGDFTDGEVVEFVFCSYTARGGHEGEGDKEQLHDFPEEVGYFGEIFIGKDAVEEGFFGDEEGDGEYHAEEPEEVDFSAQGEFLDLGFVAF